MLTVIASNACSIPLSSHPSCERSSYSMPPLRSALSVFSWPFPTCSQVQAVFCPNLFHLHLLCSPHGNDATHPCKHDGWVARNTTEARLADGKGCNSSSHL